MCARLSPSALLLKPAVDVCTHEEKRFLTVAPRMAGVRSCSRFTDGASMCAPNCLFKLNEGKCVEHILRLQPAPAGHAHAVGHVFEVPRVMGVG